jgi:hypothetical protein
MNRVNFGPRSGVIVDVCGQHGSWFDAGELALALSFVAEGGLLAARDEEPRSTPAPATPTLSLTSPVSPGDGGSALLTLLGELFNTVFRGRE